MKINKFKQLEGNAKVNYICECSEIETRYDTIKNIQFIISLFFLTLSLFLLFTSSYINSMRMVITGAIIYSIVDIINVIIKKKHLKELDKKYVRIDNNEG